MLLKIFTCRERHELQDLLLRYFVNVVVALRKGHDLAINKAALFGRLRCDAVYKG